MADSKRHLTIKEAMEMPADELIFYLNELCEVEIPPQVETIDDMKAASKLLSHCASLYSYLLSMQTTAKTLKRQYKRNGEKIATEDALVREEIFGNYAEIIKTAYSAVSRMVTIKQQIASEMRFMGDRNF